MTSFTERDTVRYIRHSEILPVDLLLKYPVMVIGVGAVGRQVALQLAAMGAGPLTLIDHDVVEAVNLGAQGYREEDLGKPKVDATAELIQQLNRSVKVLAHARRFHRSEDFAEAIFCCVDNIETRGHIFRAVKDQVRFFIDGRMSAESLRILTVCNSRSLAYYPQSLFSSREAYQGSCTARTTYYGANVIAGLMVAHFSRWLRGLEPPMDIVMNLLADEFVVRESNVASNLGGQHTSIIPAT